MEVQAVEEEAGGAAAAPPARRRARGRTSLILLVAAVLGLGGGTAYGYRVQADRAPDPLPALAQPELRYPSKPLAKGAGRKPLERSQDHLLRTEQTELPKLLVPRPKGSAEADVSVFSSRPVGDVLDLRSLAAEYLGPKAVFTDFMSNHLQTAAARDWHGPGHRDGAVRLLRFRSGAVASAVAHAAEQTYGALGDPVHAVKGSDLTAVYADKEEPKAGYLQVWSGSAYGARGDIAFEIHVYDTKPVSLATMRRLAERQLERL